MSRNCETRTVYHEYPWDERELPNLDDIMSASGTLDDQILYARIQVINAKKMQKTTEAADSENSEQAMILVREHWTYHEDGTVDHEQVRERPDWFTIIGELIDRVVFLELARYLKSLYHLLGKWETHNHE